MKTQPYQLVQPEYGFWYEVDQRFGHGVGALLAEELYKNPPERNFNKPALSGVM